MFNFLPYLMVFLLGLASGSFLNCIIYRLEKGESFLRGRSYCPNCHHKLSWPDLIPVFSFLILRGKCRYCRKPISWQYPLVELATGLVFVLIFQYLTAGKIYGSVEQSETWFIFSNTLYYWIIASFLVIIFVYDLKHYIIPDKVIYPAIGITFFYRFFEFWNFGNWNLFGICNLEFGDLEPLILTIISSAGAATFFLLIVLVSRGRWMGLGDVKLAILLGLFLGWPNILAALILAFIIGAIVGTGLMLAGKKTLKSEIPFGPFLVLGTLSVLFFGEKLINWYLNLFLT